MTDDGLFLALAPTCEVGWLPYTRPGPRQAPLTWTGPQIRAPELRSRAVAKKRTAPPAAVFAPSVVDMVTRS